MSTSKVINVDENSQEFRLELERRLKLAKNPKNRIPLSQAKKDILMQNPARYQESVRERIRKMHEQA